MMFQRFFFPSLFVSFLCVLEVRGYTPAQPANSSLQGNGQARLDLRWHTNGSYWGNVTRQLVGPNLSNDPVNGVLVHFAEDNAGNESTTTPWIAFVSCDASLTNSFHQPDIFAMARDRGAKAAILYSLYSETCVINPSYQNSVLDIFATQTLRASRSIEHEFGQFGPSSKANYGYFNAATLNGATEAINNSVASNNPAAPDFLFATLSPYDLSALSHHGIQTDANGTTTSGGGSSGDTGVAMIILYAITGCVSALFCGVVVSGAIRAVRHPERYGPRPSDPTLGGGQSRAGGLGRAILDTFPIVKFGSSGNDRGSRPKDIESTPRDTESSIPVDSVQLARVSSAAEREVPHVDHQEGPTVITSQEGDDQAGTDQDPSSTANQQASREAATLREMPEYIGRETCPICIVDFEEGDDLRVLPCEGKHRFHQSCVDPWLLELSASCPICRQDFRALETIISGGEHEAHAAHRSSISGTSIQQNRRFSRYLRFALGHQQRVRSGDQGFPSPPES